MQSEFPSYPIDILPSQELLREMESPNFAENQRKKNHGRCETERDQLDRYTRLVSYIDQLRREGFDMKDASKVAVEILRRFPITSANGTQADFEREVGKLIKQNIKPMSDKRRTEVLQEVLGVKLSVGTPTRAKAEALKNAGVCLSMDEEAMLATPPTKADARHDEVLRELLGEPAQAPQRPARKSWDIAENRGGKPARTPRPDPAAVEAALAEGLTEAEQAELGELLAESNRMDRQKVPFGKTLLAMMRNNAGKGKR